MSTLSLGKRTSLIKFSAKLGSLTLVRLFWTYDVFDSRGGFGD